MMRLAIGDLRDHAATWAGAFAVAVACGYIGGWAASIAATARTYPNLQDMAQMVALFSAVAAVAVLSQAANLTVDAQRRTYALWQLANVSPRRVGAVVLVQLALVALLGAACGTLFEAVTFEPLFPVVFSSPFYAPPPGTAVALDAGVELMPVVWLAVAGTFLLGGMRGACNAAKTSLMAALRESRPKRGGMTRMRVLLFTALAVGTGCFAASLVTSEPVDAFQNALFLPLLAVAILVPAAPFVLPAVLTAWTAVVPQGRLCAWYVAHRAARYGLAGSTSTELPILVGFGLVAGIYSLGNLGSAYVEAHAMTGYSTTLDWTSAVLLLGGPVLLAVVGAAVGVVMTARTRTRDVFLLLAMGARPRALIAAAVCEAVIHVVTATLVAAAAVVVSNVVVACACGLPPFTGLTFSEGFVIAGAGFVLVLAATLVPTCAALRHPPAEALAARE